MLQRPWLAPISTCLLCFCCLFGIGCGGTSQIDTACLEELLPPIFYSCSDPTTRGIPYLTNATAGSATLYKQSIRLLAAAAIQRCTDFGLRRDAQVLVPPLSPSRVLREEIEVLQTDFAAYPGGVVRTALTQPSSLDDWEEAASAAIARAGAAMGQDLGQDPQAVYGNISTVAYDGWLLPYSALQNLGSTSGVLDLASISSLDPALGRPGIHPTLLAAVGWGSQALAGVPLDGGQLLLFARRDVMETLEGLGLGRGLLESWEGLLQMAAAANGTLAKSLNDAGGGTGATVDGGGAHDTVTSITTALQPVFGFCLPPSSRLLASLALAVLAPVVQRTGTRQGMYFGAENLQAAVATAAMPYVLSYLRRLAAYSAPVHFSLTAPQFSEDFARGHCAFTVGTSSQFRRNSHIDHPAGASAVAGRILTLLLPGSDRVLSDIPHFPLSPPPTQAQPPQPPPSQPPQPPPLLQQEPQPQQTESDSGSSRGLLAPCTPQLCPYAQPAPAHYYAPAADATAVEVPSALMISSGGSGSSGDDRVGAGGTGGSVLVSRAPLLLPDAVMAVVAARSEPMAQLHWWGLISRLGGEEVGWKLLLAADAEVGPWRLTHTDLVELPRWVAAGFNSYDTVSYLEAARGTLEHANVVLPLRMRSAVWHNRALRNAVQSVLEAALATPARTSSNQSADADAAVAAAEALALGNLVSIVSGLYGTNSTTSGDGDNADGGRQSLLSEYRRSLGLPSLSNLTEFKGSNPTAPSTAAAANSFHSFVMGAAIGGSLLALLAGLLAVRVLGGRQRCRRRRHRWAWRVVEPPGATLDTVLLVTDIEGSTALWEALPEEVMDVALRTHHAVVRSVGVSYGAYESATEGDSFILAFHSAAPAAQFALGLQRALLEATWPQRLLAVPTCAPVYVRRLDAVARANLVSLASTTPATLRLRSRSRQWGHGAATAAAAVAAASGGSRFHFHQAALQSVASNPSRRVMQMQAAAALPPPSTHVLEDAAVSELVIGRLCAPRRASMLSFARSGVSMVQPGGLTVAAVVATGSGGGDTSGGPSTGACLRPVQQHSPRRQTRGSLPARTAVVTHTMPHAAFSTGRRARRRSDTMTGAYLLKVRMDDIRHSSSIASIQDSFLSSGGRSGGETEDLLRRMKAPPPVVAEAAVKLTTTKTTAAAALVAPPPSSDMIALWKRRASSAILTRDPNHWQTSVVGGAGFGGGGGGSGGSAFAPVVAATATRQGTRSHRTGHPLDGIPFSSTHRLSTRQGLTPAALSSHRLRRVSLLVTNWLGLGGMAAASGGGGSLSTDPDMSRRGGSCSNVAVKEVAVEAVTGDIGGTTTTALRWLDSSVEGDGSARAGSAHGGGFAAIALARSRPASQHFAELVSNRRASLLSILRPISSSKALNVPSSQMPSTTGACHRHSMQLDAQVHAPLPLPPLQSSPPQDSFSQPPSFICGDTSVTAAVNSLLPCAWGSHVDALEPLAVLEAGDGATTDPRDNEAQVGSGHVAMLAAAVSGAWPPMRPADLAMLMSIGTTKVAVSELGPGCGSGADINPLDVAASSPPSPSGFPMLAGPSPSPPPPQLPQTAVAVSPELECHNNFARASVPPSLAHLRQEVQPLDAASPPSAGTVAAATAGNRVLCRKLSGPPSHRSSHNSPFLSIGSPLRMANGPRRTLPFVTPNFLDELQLAQAPPAIALSVAPWRASPNSPLRLSQTRGNAAAAANANASFGQESSSPSALRYLAATASTSLEAVPASLIGKLSQRHSLPNRKACKLPSPSPRQKLLEQRGSSGSGVAPACNGLRVGSYNSTVALHRRFSELAEEMAFPTICSTRPRSRPDMIAAALPDSHVDSNPGGSMKPQFNRSLSVTDGHRSRTCGSGAASNTASATTSAGIGVRRFCSFTSLRRGLSTAATTDPRVALLKSIPSATSAAAAAATGVVLDIEARGDCCGASPVPTFGIVNLGPYGVSGRSPLTQPLQQQQQKPPSGASGTVVAGPLSRLRLTSRARYSMEPLTEEAAASTVAGMGRATAVAAGVQSPVTHPRSPSLLPPWSSLPGRRTLTSVLSLARSRVDSLSIELDPIHSQSLSGTAAGTVSCQGENAGEREHGPGPGQGWQGPTTVLATENAKGVKAGRQLLALQRLWEAFAGNRVGSGYRTATGDDSDVSTGLVSHDTAACRSQYGDSTAVPPPPAAPLLASDGAVVDLPALLCVSTSAEPWDVNERPTFDDVAAGAGPALEVGAKYCSHSTLALATSPLLPAPQASPLKLPTRGSLLEMIHSVFVPVASAEQQQQQQSQNASDATALLVFAGLRVRVGLSCGVTDPRDIQYNAATARMTFGGEALRIAKAVCDCASGGQILLSGEVLLRLQLADAGAGPGGLGSQQLLLTWQAHLLDLGDHQLLDEPPQQQPHYNCSCNYQSRQLPQLPHVNSDLPRSTVEASQHPSHGAPPPAAPLSRHLLALSSTGLLGRMALIPPVRSAPHRRYTTACVDAPVGPSVSIVVFRVSHASSLLSYNATLAAESMALLELYLRASMGPLLNTSSTTPTTAAAAACEGEEKRLSLETVASGAATPAAVLCYLAAAPPGSPFGTFVAGFNQAAVAARWALEVVNRLSELPWSPELLQTPWGRPLEDISLAEAEAVDSGLRGLLRVNTAAAAASAAASAPHGGGGGGGDGLLSQPSSARPTPSFSRGSASLPDFNTLPAPPSLLSSPSIAPGLPTCSMVPESTDGTAAEICGGGTGAIAIGNGFDRSHSVRVCNDLQPVDPGSCIPAAAAAVPFFTQLSATLLTSIGAGSEQAGTSTEPQNLQLHLNPLFDGEARQFPPDSSHVNVEPEGMPSSSHGETVASAVTSPAVGPAVADGGSLRLHLSPSSRQVASGRQQPTPKVNLTNWNMSGFATRRSVCMQPLSMLRQTDSSLPVQQHQQQHQCCCEDVQAQPLLPHALSLSPSPSPSPLPGDLLKHCNDTAVGDVVDGPMGRLGANRNSHRMPHARVAISDCGPDYDDAPAASPLMSPLYTPPIITTTAAATAGATAASGPAAICVANAVSNNAAPTSHYYRNSPPLPEVETLEALEDVALETVAFSSVDGVEGQQQQQQGLPPSSSQLLPELTSRPMRLRSKWQQIAQSMSILGLWRQAAGLRIGTASDATAHSASTSVDGARTAAATGMAAGTIAGGSSSQGGGVGSSGPAPVAFYSRFASRGRMLECRRAERQVGSGGGGGEADAVAAVAAVTAARAARTAEDAAIVTLRGLRVRAGLALGAVRTELCPLTGRVVYSGKAVTAAMTAAAAARLGTLYVTQVAAELISGPEAGTVAADGSCKRQQGQEQGRQRLRVRKDASLRRGLTLQEDHLLNNLETGLGGDTVCRRMPCRSYTMMEDGFRSASAADAEGVPRQGQASVVGSAAAAVASAVSERMHLLRPTIATVSGRVRNLSGGRDRKRQLFSPFKAETIDDSRSSKSSSSSSSSSVTSGGEINPVRHADPATMEAKTKGLADLEPRLQCTPATGQVAVGMGGSSLAAPLLAPRNAPYRCCLVGSRGQPAVVPVAREPN